MRTASHFRTACSWWLRPCRNTRKGGRQRGWGEGHLNEKEATGVRFAVEEGVRLHARRWGSGRRRVVIELVVSDAYKTTWVLAGTNRMGVCDRTARIKRGR